VSRDGGKQAASIERAYFDDRIREEGAFDPFAPRAWATLRKRFIDLIDPAEPLRILDVGCGTGQSRQIYASSASTYAGVDLSWSCVAAAHSAEPGVRWCEANALELPFDDASFEVVAFSSVLHHIPRFELALVEASRVLAPGGRVFAFDPNLRHPAMALFRSPRSPFYIRAGVSPNERPLFPRELRAAFETAGFIRIRQRCQSDIPYRRVAPRLINAMLGAYNLADRLLEYSGLGRIFGTFVVTVATKRTS
jgi:SAM-dependent methyltransferase